MARKKTLPSNAKGSLRERAYAHIQRKIASGEMKPDSPVSEQIIAQELGMSRTPVREAIGQLTAEGLLEQTANRGTLVVQFKRQDIIDLYELREALEVYSVSKAARSSVRPVDLARWQDIVDEILVLKRELDQSGKPTLDFEQMHRFVTSDLTFHVMLMRLAVNHRMLKVVNERASSSAFSPSIGPDTMPLSWSRFTISTARLSRLLPNIIRKSRPSYSPTIFASAWRNDCLHTMPGSTRPPCKKAFPTSSGLWETWTKFAALLVVVPKVAVSHSCCARMGHLRSA